YNLRIADHHTYFVGARDWGFSVWAHNTCAEFIEFAAERLGINRGRALEIWNAATNNGQEWHSQTSNILANELRAATTHDQANMVEVGLMVARARNAETAQAVAEFFPFALERAAELRSQTPGVLENNVMAIMKVELEFRGGGGIDELIF